MIRKRDSEFQGEGSSINNDKSYSHNMENRRYDDNIGLLTDQDNKFEIYEIYSDREASRHYNNNNIYTSDQHQHWENGNY